MTRLLLESAVARILLPRFRATYHHAVNRLRAEMAAGRCPEGNRNIRVRHVPTSQHANRYGRWVAKGRRTAVAGDGCHARDHESVRDWHAELRTAPHPVRVHHAVGHADVMRVCAAGR